MRNNELIKYFTDQVEQKGYSTQLEGGDGITRWVYGIGYFIDITWIFLEGTVSDRLRELNSNWTITIEFSLYKVCVLIWIKWLRHILYNQSKTIPIDSVLFINE